jgi:hypothetical protein
MRPEPLRLLKFCIRHPETWHVFSRDNNAKAKRALRTLERLGLVEVQRVAPSAGANRFRLARCAP